MCGIVGSFGRSPVETEALKKAMGQLDHRGPDSSASLTDNDFRLGHTLLSIIGDRPQVQPLTSQDNRIALIFNGEIYNYIELRNQFPELRARCRSDSDSEVLVEGLALFGINFISNLNGIFAIAFFDRQTKTGYLVRDRLGVKPLCYTTKRSPENGFQILFASELKALQSYASRSEPEADAYYSYACFRYPIGGLTYTNSIYSLKPGSYLEIRDQKIKISEYWKPFEVSTFSGSYEEARARTKALLEDSIRLQTRSNHSYCTLLSGGLDSSYVTAIAGRYSPQLDTYSVGFKDENFDESKFAARVSMQYQSTHHFLNLKTETFQSDHRKFIEHLGHPVSVPNQVALFRLSAEVSKRHRCALAGEGADEIFGGYGRIFLLPHDYERARIQNKFSGSFEDFFIERYRYLDHSAASLALQTYFSRTEIDHSRLRIEEEIKKLFRECAHLDPYLQVILIFQSLHLPGLLHRLDTASMAHSVEARVPFLDHRLVELMNSLPFEFKVKKKFEMAEMSMADLAAQEISEIYDIPKFILKDIAQEHLPAEIVFRKKMGFPIPPSYLGPEGSSYVSWVNSNLSLCLGGNAL